MADKPEGIGVLLAVDIEPGPFLPGPGIYPVGMEVFPVIRQVDIGELDAGRVVLPVQGYRDWVLAVIGFLLFRAAERYAAVSFHELTRERTTIIKTEHYMNSIKDLQKAVRNILVNNGLTELSLEDTGELEDPTYIIWFDGDSGFFEDRKSTRLNSSH